MVCVLPAGKSPTTSAFAPCSAPKQSFGLRKLMNFWFVGRLLLPINRDRNDKSGNEGESNSPRKIWHFLRFPKSLRSWVNLSQKEVLAWGRSLGLNLPTTCEENSKIRRLIFPRKNDQKTTPLEFSFKLKSGSP